MTAVNLEHGPAKAAPTKLTLRLAALVIGHDGVLPHAVALAVAEGLRGGARTPGQMVASAMRPLVHAGVVVRHEDTWYAPVLATLAGWLADGLEYREDAGMAADPVLPPGAPRPVIPAQAGRASVAA